MIKIIEDAFKLDTNEILLGIVLFTLPLSLKINSISLVVLGIYNLVLQIRSKSIFGMNIFMVFVLFFSVQLLSFFLSTNTEEALKKLILFGCFPIFWFFNPLKRIKLERVFLWLVFGTFVIIIYAISSALYEIVVNGARYDYGRGPELLLKFAPHHAYLSMFIIVSILTTLYSVGERIIKPVFLLLVVPLIMVLFILPSRTALLMSFFVLPIFGFWFLRHFFERKTLIVFGFILITLFVIGLSFDFARDKLLYAYYELFKIETVEKPFYGIGRREKIWQAAISLLSELPLLGYSIGDIQQVLDSKYIELGYDEVVGYNAHNQFLQYTLQYGFLLSIIMGTPLIFVIVSLFRKKEQLLVSLWVVLILFCLSESMLNRQWGIIFFSALLSLSCQRINLDSHQRNQ